MHHRLVFSKSVFFGVIFFVIPFVCFPRSLLQVIFHVICPFILSVMFFFSHILLKNCFISFASSHWLVLIHSLPTCWNNFLILLKKVQFCLYSLTLSRYFFSLSFFASIFWFLSSNYIASLVWKPPSSTLTITLQGLHKFSLLFSHHHHHHHVALSAQIFLTVSSQTSLSSIAFGRATSRIGTELLYVGSNRTSCLCQCQVVHRRTSLTSSSLLLKQCPACLVRLILIVFVMGAALWSVVSRTSFFSICLVRVHVVHPYSSIDTIAAWKKLRFILSVMFDFHMTERL